MSWRFVTEVWGYVQHGRVASAATLRGLSLQLWRTAQRGLPVEVVLETFRLPVHGLQTPEDVFAIPHDDMFYLDVAGDEGVLSADELRTRYHGLLAGAASPAGAVVWILRDVCTGGCRALLHLVRDPHTMDVQALFLVDEALAAGAPPRSVAMHEALLLSLLAFCDCRHLDIRMRPASHPLFVFLQAIMGFLRPDCAPGKKKNSRRQSARGIPPRRWCARPSPRSP
jgi:hypothetical protein